jgi:hypothetical protein
MRRISPFIKGHRYVATIERVSTDGRVSTCAREIQFAIGPVKEERLKVPIKGVFDSLLPSVQRRPGSLLPFGPKHRVHHGQYMLPYEHQSGRAQYRPQCCLRGYHGRCCCAFFCFRKGRVVQGPSGHNPGPPASPAHLFTPFFALPVAPPLSENGEAGGDFRLPGRHRFFLHRRQ